MDVLNLNVDFLTNTLYNALSDLTNQALAVSDYNAYKRAKSNLQIIDKYQSKKKEE